MKNINLQKKKTLILTQTDPNIDTMFKSWIKCGLKANIIFKNVSKPLRALRRIMVTIMPTRFISIWLNNWKKDLSKYDTIIIHASELTNHLPEYIHHVNPKLRIIYWYWNPVNKRTLPELVTDKNVEFWTFNRRDQCKYNMKYNIQYYNSCIENKEKFKIRYDVYYIGHDKGRRKYLEKLKRLMESQGLICNFTIIPDKSDKYVPYSLVKKNLLMSKAILEINQNGQDGYTLRALEALFLKKKLITNNKALKNADFYFKDNIYILGENDGVNINNFLKKTYNHKADLFINNYTVEAWFNNFFGE